MLVLRAFLGVTFLFAGLQKLANPGFFNSKSPTGLEAQLVGSMRSSPIRPLLHLVAHQPVLFGVAIAVSEVAVGIGTLAGMFSRIAAGGGLCLSLSFFLSISYATTPYYYGSDIVFVFAWTVLLLGGSGPYSLDTILETTRLSAVAASRRETAMTRRAVLSRGGALALGAVTTAVLAGVDAAIGRAASHHAAVASTTVPTLAASGNSGAGSSSNSGSSGGSNSPRVAILDTSAVEVGNAAMFTDPVDGQPAFALQPSAGRYLAFSAVCTHAGCTVAYDGATDTFNCPCHGSIYNAMTGAVIQGPAPAPLPEIPVTASDGKLYLQS